MEKLLSEHASIVAYTWLILVRELMVEITLNRSFKHTFNSMFNYITDVIKT